MPTRVVVLGAGFGGMELSTMLSEEAGDLVEVTLVDSGDSFVFGFSKLDVLFGRTAVDSVRLPYSSFRHPSVRLLRETITAIDPAAKVVATDAGTHEADILVVALGADYDLTATPGLAEAGNEFYSVPGAARLAEILAAAEPGNYVIGVCDAPYKCPPAPSECALLLHNHLVARGIREESTITFTIPLPSPVPPAPEASRALLAEFAERDIRFVPGVRIASLDGARGIVLLDDGRELPYDVFLGVPKHHAPQVVLDSGMAEDGYIPVDPSTLASRFPDVYAVGDVATAGVPKAGVFSEGAAKVVARSIIARLHGGEAPAPYDGVGICYVEFGDDRVGRVRVDFLSGPKPTGSLDGPNAGYAAEKGEWAASRRARWFGV
ncbi:MAG: FAD-dependent oxidoreductase [Thermoleophilaceae bacterium]|nr:FAD-dependent oxidoreductase [Thermoleophilaceae bacterium]